MFPKLNIAGFSPSACRALAQASQAAYEPESSTIALAEIYGTSMFRFIEGKDTGTQCFVARRGKDLVIAFRGTTDFQDWKTDSKVRLADWNGRKVHRGFLAAYKSVQETIRKQISVLHNMYITGHSLGGALAILCALDLQEYGYNIAGVYTFGQPRVGNGAFARYYNGSLREKTFRIVNENDIVPRLPSWFSGYRHCGTEVYCDQFGSVLINPAWWQKIPGDIWGFVKTFDPVLPPVTALKVATDHAMKKYTERIFS